MKKINYLLLILCLIIPLRVSAEDLDKETTPQTKEVIVSLEACVDGDTARFKNSEGEVIKARFLAVDTPETVHPTKEVEAYGKEASSYTCTNLTDATEIKLEYDFGSNEQDNYGRDLVWIFVDGKLLQEYLVREGYAKVAYLYGDYKYTTLLQDTEEIAKAEKIGIWSDEEKEETQENVVEKTTKHAKKGFIQNLVNSIFTKIFDAIDQLIENILETIESML